MHIQVTPEASEFRVMCLLMMGDRGGAIKYEAVVKWKADAKIVECESRLGSFRSIWLGNVT